MRARLGLPALEGDRPGAGADEYANKIGSLGRDALRWLGSRQRIARHVSSCRVPLASLPGMIRRQRQTAAVGVHRVHVRRVAAA